MSELGSRGAGTAVMFFAFFSLFDIVTKSKVEASKKNSLKISSVIPLR